MGTAILWDKDISSHFVQVSVDIICLLVMKIPNLFLSSLRYHNTDLIIVSAAQIVIKRESKRMKSSAILCLKFSLNSSEFPAFPGQ